MVRVCDAIMGSGKSQSAIAYMNSHPEKRFIYTTPLLTEAQRIKDGCPDLHFVEPRDDLPQYNRRKIEHTAALIAEGKNISTTHVAFKHYSQELVEMIRENHYTLIMDETVDVFAKDVATSGDINILLDSGYIVEDGDSFRYTGKEIERGQMDRILKMVICNNLLQIKKESQPKIDSENAEKKSLRQFYYWMIPHEVFSAFEDVFVLTYMFDCSDLRYYFDMYNVEYHNIGIHREGDSYSFVDSPDYIPPHVKTLKDKIHIYQDPTKRETGRINKVGNRRTALSKRWFSSNPEGRETLRKNMYNYFRNIRHAKSDDIMWATYKDYADDFNPRRYGKNEVAFNTKATNQYRNKTELAYLVNVFADPNKKIFFNEQHGMGYDEDMAALSIMLQWIWRSAIRDGKDIYIYVPSRRMRTFLENWLEEVSSN